MTLKMDSLNLMGVIIQMISSQKDGGYWIIKDKSISMIIKAIFMENMKKAMKIKISKFKRMLNRFNDYSFFTNIFI